MWAGGGFFMNERIDELRRTVRDDPGSRRFFQLGDLLRKAGEIDEAEETLKSGLDHHPRYVAAWTSLGRIQLEKEEFSDAERSFARVLELDPENAVAALLLGETAEQAGEWLRAVKAFKLARALAPRDPDLDEKIEELERRLDGDPDPEPAVPEPQAPPPMSRPRNVVSMSEDDPFGFDSVPLVETWQAADDVFAPFEESPVTLPEPPGQEDAVFPTGAEDQPAEPPEEIETPQWPEVPSELVPEIADPAVEPPEAVDAEVEDDPSADQDLPLPTVTLARLAFEQGDLALATETLRSVLERDPENREAATLLSSVQEGPAVLSEAPDQAAVTSLAESKASVLKGWMEGVRSAAERNKL